MQTAEEKMTLYYNGDQTDPSFKVLESAIEERGHYLVEFYNEFLIDVYVLADKPDSKFIAVDWDNTISADFKFFKSLIKRLKDAGYEPFVCTLRAPDKENIEEIISVLEAANIAIYLTDGHEKRAYMKDLDVDVHMWIDDFYPGVCGDTSSLLTRNCIE